MTIWMTSKHADPWHIHVSKNIKQHWDRFSLEYMKKINRDRVIIVDGQEGVGKSLWTIQQAHYLEPGMFESKEKMCSRIVFSPDEFLEAVRNNKNCVIIFDEAFRGFSSRSALSKINKSLVQALMEMRQNNNIVFIVLPSFFMLDIYPAMLRSNSLFNIYFPRQGRRRAWRGFNKADKNSIYQVGVKKGWKYTMGTKFRGYFYGKFPGGDEFREAYEEKKYKAFRDEGKTEKKSDEMVKLQNKLDSLIKYAYNKEKSYAKVTKAVGEHGFVTSPSTLAREFARINGKTP